MSIKSPLILSLLFSSIFGYSQGKTTFNTYTGGNNKRIALKSDSTFIFCSTFGKTVSGKYTIKKSIYYLMCCTLNMIPSLLGELPSMIQRVYTYRIKPLITL